MAKADISIEGFVAKNPEQRPAGNHTVTTVTIPVEKGRVKDGQWVAETDRDGQKVVVWWEAEFWDEHGQQVAQEIQKGYLVRVAGEAWPRAYVKKDGTAGQAATITNPTISIVVRRPPRQDRGQGGFQQPHHATNQGGMGDWATPPQKDAQGGFDNEQPF